MEIKTLIKTLDAIIKGGKYYEASYSGNLKEEGTMYKKRQFCKECGEITEQTWYPDGRVGEEGLRNSYFQCNECGSSWYLSRFTGKWDASVPWEYQEEEIELETISRKISGKRRR